MGNLSSIYDFYRIQRVLTCYNRERWSDPKDTVVQDSSHGQPHISARRCRVCGRCIDACPRGVLELDEDRICIIHPELCDACLACEEACEQAAIEVSFAIVWARSVADPPDRD